MCEEQPQAFLPEEITWVELTDKVLKSDARQYWCKLVNDFKPVEHQEAEDMADWLRECVNDGKMPLRTLAAVHDDRLLGFFSIKRVYYQVSNRARTVLAIAQRVGLERPQPGLLLSSIVRSRLTQPGFGRLLIEEAVGLALGETGDPPITALLVEPANDRLAEMWKENHHFAELDDSHQLHFPLKLPEELEGD